MERSWVEVGNTTFKLARPREGEKGWSVSRFKSISGLLGAVDERSEIIVAPVAEERAAELQRVSSERELHVRTIGRGSLLSFIGDSYDTPETLGLDRILNLAGLRGDGVVMSCGTCITVDAIIESRPAFGAILPGFATASRGMMAAVPVLPKPALEATPGIPSRSSQNSVDLGILHGTMHAALGIARSLAESVQRNPESPPLVLTGGGAGLMARMVREIGGDGDWTADSVVTVPGLLFDGMRRAIEF